VQERQTLIMTQAYGMEACASGCSTSTGPGQALSNPYTGVLAIFASRLLNNQPPMIFEDGEQRRDFVYVGDVAAPSPTRWSCRRRPAACSTSGPGATGR
jgi:dTDP-L-rhamnose 4-epimerase